MTERIRWSGLGMLVGLALCGCSQSPVAAPTGYKQWNAKDGTFLIEYPDDWEADGGGKRGVQWATFKKGTAQIDVEVNRSDSIVGDILGAGGGAAGMATGDATLDVEEIPPVAIIHMDESKRNAMEELFSDYGEKEALEITPPLGQGRKSEFRGKKGLSQMHGYRATIINGERGIIVICQCREDDWPKLQAAFDKILDGMEFGTPEM